MQPEVSKQLDKLLKDLKEKISQHPDLQHIDPASLSLKVKLKVKLQAAAHALAARAINCPSGCFDCTAEGCVCVPC